MLQNAPMYSYIPAKDVARARAFYEEKLDFKPKEVSAGGVTYEFANGTACFLYPTPNAGTSQASKAFWQVEDIEKEVAELMARGVKFREIRHAGYRREGHFKCRPCKRLALQDERGVLRCLRLDAQLARSSAANFCLASSSRWA